MEQGNAQGGTGIGLLADGLDNADISLHDFEHSGCTGVGVRAIGGPLMAAGKPRQVASPSLEVRPATTPCRTMCKTAGDCSPRTSGTKVRRRALSI